MNPYLKERNDLPDNLKSLFRPNWFIMADFNLICEIILMADGIFKKFKYIIF